MYCPKCGQPQVTESVRFCSRCGFSLVEVTGLLEPGGAAGAPPEDDVRPARGVRQAMYFMMAALPFLLLALLAGLAGIDGVPEIFGILAMSTFLIGALRLIYVAAFKGRRHRPIALPPGQTTSPIQAPQQHALPPSYVPPVDVPRARFDTGESVQPPSVTEHTTRHLEQEPPREREH
jgi:hypothetical protein